MYTRYMHSLRIFLSAVRLQVVCGPCSSYAGHLYEVLGAELGVADGMTMKSFFCSELTTACAGQISFPTYLGQSYCGKHVGGGDDQLWSYPIDEEGVSGWGPQLSLSFAFGTDKKSYRYWWVVSRRSKHVPKSRANNKRTVPPGRQREVIIRLDS